jgi:DNA mismatch endonuclease Vsr
VTRPPNFRLRQGFDGQGGCSGFPGECIISLRQGYGWQAGWRRGCSLALAPRSAKEQGTSAKRQVRKLSGLKIGRSSGRVKPDFVFQQLKTAVFVDGCFWHGCPKHATRPKTRAAFWQEKITGNKARDRRVNSALRKRGWTVVRVWEHELRRRDEAKLIRRLSNLCPRRP